MIHFGAKNQPIAEPVLPVASNRKSAETVTQQVKQASKLVNHVTRRTEIIDPDKWLDRFDGHFVPKEDEPSEVGPIVTPPPVHVMSPREQINEHHPILALTKNDRNTLSVVNTHVHNTLSQLTIDTSNQTENAPPESEEHMYLKKRAPSHDLQPHGKTWDATTEAVAKHPGLAANIT